MNDKKICFIICTNNEMLLNECIEYINRLYVPDGYELDLLTVTEASSMTSGYNEAMRASDAHYKIYMHQDVYIINRYFIYDLLKIFESDDNIGMIGMVGYPEISPFGMMWMEERVGETPMYGSGHYKNHKLSDYRYEIEAGVSEVKVADGLLLATCHDVLWDEEFDGWDFYDATQCARFINEGYKVVVPTQQYPWVVHDDGTYLSLWNYNKYRKMYIKKYLNKDV